MSRLDDAFAAARAEDRAAFVAYLPAGYPDRDAFLRHAREVLRHADVLEIGLPYSDPLGDGPTIQAAGDAALRAGVTTPDVLEMVRTLRAETDRALCVMTYYNPIYAYRDGGEAGFVRDVAAAGADGLILPDLPPDEGPELIERAREADLDTVFLVAPTSTPERIATVAAACRGFVYAVSVTGVTGARDALPDDVGELVARVHAASGLPVAVGFGVSGGAAARRVAAVADGVIVGSALVRAIGDGGDPAGLAAEIAAACRR